VKQDVGGGGGPAAGAGGGGEGAAEGEDQADETVTVRSQAMERARAWDGFESGGGLTFSLLEQAAATPALARDAAVQRARGTWLAMVDGRDALPGYALHYS
jgi:hypothetical protein